MTYNVLMGRPYSLTHSLTHSLPVPGTSLRIKWNFSGTREQFRPVTPTTTYMDIRGTRSQVHGVKGHRLQQ